MPSDLHSDSRKFSDSTEPQSQQPLLSGDHHVPQHALPALLRPTTLSRRSTLHGTSDLGQLAAIATRRRYVYAAFFLVASLAGFCVQTETAVYIQKELGWNKPYCMLYLTHSTWILLWPVSLLCLWWQKRNRGIRWKASWRRHYILLRQTAQMVRYNALHLQPWQQEISPWGYMLKVTAWVTCALTVGSGSWYLAADLTPASDLTAIYNCSAFFAYMFSVPILKEKMRLSKMSAVAIAIFGVLVVAYGGQASPSKIPPPNNNIGIEEIDQSTSDYRFLGNVIIGIGSIVYGLYEVLYKKVACPPDDTSPGRGVIFANAFGSMMGLFTLSVLWIPLVFLHISGLETFQLPRGEQAYMMLISVISGAVFCGSFLVLISLTSPVLSSVASLLTIFIIALIDQLLPPPLNNPLSGAAIVGGLLIMCAFVLLSWGTYTEMREEKKRRYSAGHVSESDTSSDDNAG